MSLRDDLIKHAIFIQRYVGSHNKMLRSTLVNVVGGLTNSLNDPIINYTTIKQKITDELNNFKEDSLKELQKLAEYENSFMTRKLNKELKKEIRQPKKSVIVEDLKIALTTNARNVNLERAYELYIDHSSDKIVQVIKDNFNSSIEDIKKQVTLLATGLIITRGKALLTTVINTVVQEVRRALLGINRMKLIWDAILDELVCKYCRELDGRYFTVDTAPPCPLHANCRCQLIPVNE